MPHGTPSSNVNFRVTRERARIPASPEKPGAAALWMGKKRGNLVRPERFELPTYCSGGNRSIQLSYGRTPLEPVYMCRLRPSTLEPGWSGKGRSFTGKRGRLSLRQGWSVIFRVPILPQE